jgi:hypothetical protein
MLKLFTFVQIAADSLRNREEGRRWRSTAWSSP